VLLSVLHAVVSLVTPSRTGRRLSLICVSLHVACLACAFAMLACTRPRTVAAPSLVHACLHLLWPRLFVLHTHDAPSDSMVPRFHGRILTLSVPLSLWLLSVLACCCPFCDLLCCPIACPRLLALVVVPLVRSARLRDTCSHLA
jgi:hypothetical protein